MNITAALIKQIIIMFVLMLIGFTLYKKKMITDQGSKDLGKLLLYVVIPVVIINNFCIENTKESVAELLHSLLIAVVCMFVAIVIAYLIFGKRDGIANFSSSFSNAGFIGIPLVQATLGSEAVFYISIMIVLINVLQWTYGVFIMTGDASVMKPKKIITNPIVISVAIGLIIFATQLPIPETVSKIFTTISGLNTPLAMIVSGVYLAQSDLVKMIKNKHIYVVSFVRLLLIPVVTILVFKVLPFGSETLKTAILIAAACPVGSNVAIFAQAYGKDYTSSVEMVCMTTILCLITLPLVIYFASIII